jgi:cell division protein FtsW (lipid II flippase)
MPGMDPALTQKLSRIRGWLLVVLGSLLSAGITVIAAILASTIHNDQPSGSHWTGNHEFTVRVFELFAAVFVFGLVALAGGVFQLRRGRPSWPAMIVMLALVAVMFFLGKQIVGAPQ